MSVTGRASRRVPVGGPPAGRADDRRYRNGGRCRATTPSHRPSPSTPRAWRGARRAPTGQAGNRTSRRRSPARTVSGLADWLAARFRQHAGNADVVRQDLLREHGIAVSLRTVERAVAPLRRELRAEGLATVRFETPPGKQLQIDFGERRVRIAGVSVKVFVFVATLGYSRCSRGRRGERVASRHHPPRRHRRSAGCLRRTRPTRAAARADCQVSLQGNVCLQAAKSKRSRRRVRGCRAASRSKPPPPAAPPPPFGGLPTANPPYALRARRCAGRARA